MVLFVRALIAFIVLPGMVAFALPWRLHPRGATFHFSGLPFLGAGTFLLLWCVRDFYVAGQGTLAPWSPPTRLVRVGLYRVSRNPMYIAVLLALVGWTLAFPSPVLLYYLIAVSIAFHLRVVAFEEPWLAVAHGEEWLAYRAAVPRWLGWLTIAAVRSP